MAKKIKAFIKLQIPAAKANPSPPVGPALGQHGVQIMDFCKQFNDKTKTMNPGDPVPVVITVYADRSFTFEVKTPPASFLIKKELGLKSGSSVPNKDKVGDITVEQLEKIVVVKGADLTGGSLKANMRTIAGTARSMGVNVPEEIYADEGEK